MRYILKLIPMLLAALGAQAQDWHPVDAHRYADETVVYARLTVNDERQGAGYQMAAFIDGECRAVCTQATSGADGLPLFVLRVHGDRNADQGKSVSFEICETARQLVYDVVPTASGGVVFDGESWGMPSSPLHFALRVARSFALQPMTLKAGLTLLVTDYLSASPADGQWPKNMSCRFQETDDRIATLSGFTVTAHGAGRLLVVVDMGTESISAWLTVTEGIALQGFRLSAPVLAEGTAATVVLHPQPVDADFDAASVQLKAQPLGGDWEMAVVEPTADAPLTFTLTPLLPGQLVLTASVGARSVPLFTADGQATITSLEVAALLRLSEGWQWRTNNYGDLDGDHMADAFGGNALTEVRTQQSLLYNDPEWGYFGTLMNEGLPQDKAYKVLMASDHTGLMHDGYHPGALSVSLNGDWTWIPTPYYYNRTLQAAFAAMADRLPEGLVVISKEQGSAEWDGTQWVGDLAVLPARESFLCYNPLNAPFNLTFADELATMPQGDDLPAAARREESATASPWHYDARRFRDNLTLVVALPQIDRPDAYSIGAFVGGEGRGEGRHVGEGRYFVTVHAEGGERVAFRLADRHGRQYAIDETVVFNQLRLGSLGQPLLLHSQEAVQGISSVQSSEFIVHSYDLQGRRTADSSARAGLRIVRRSDGTVCKVVGR